jgi:CRISPR-associated endonuclease/helicase Cas3
LPIAHSPNNSGIPHDLVKHLKDVAKQAKEFAAKFGAADLGYWIGLWHDLGKFNPDFQEYLKAQDEARPTSKVRHAIWGALLAYRLLLQFRLPWEEIVLPIAGHHAGLKDPGYLLGQMEEKAQTAEGKSLLLLVRDAARSLPQPKVKSVSRSDTRRELFIRILFSAMVDADYLDTESHFKPAHTLLRSATVNLQSLWEKFQRKQGAFLQNLRDRKETPVNRVRREVYENCLRAAEGPQGVYRLTVPTGGGKTRSGLAFALRHALQHGLERVVIAIPYTSIIEQTADIYREILGDASVVEHHSNLPWREDNELDEISLYLRLASENWDAPLVVTTTVQLFESLLNDQPSRCRKLHNLARSVIVLDEVQTLPVELLKPTLDVLRTLVEGYEVTVVLSTATQPAFAGESPYLDGFAGLEVREIVPNPKLLFKALDRVEYELRPTSMAWEVLAEELGSFPQVMVVLNTRHDALKLVELIEGKTEAVYHLSTLLCGAHRRRVLEEIRNRLRKGLPVQLISTQVVEAGVDLDFPVVYRAIGPLDRIAQVAGRCNREGKLPQGKVILFETPESHTPMGPYKKGIEKARSLLHQYDDQALKDFEIYTLYFHRLYQDVELDEANIQERRRLLDYPTVAERYRLIKEDTTPVIVPYGEALNLLSEWGRFGPSRTLWRRLQSYVVNLYSREANRLLQEGWVREVGWGLYAWGGGYDERKGLYHLSPVHDPCDLVV